MTTFVVSRPKTTFGPSGPAGEAAVDSAITSNNGTNVSHGWGSDIVVASFSARSDAETFSLLSTVMGTVYPTQATAFEHARFLATGDGS